MSDQQKRLTYFLPNVFTALNMACGFAAIIFSMKGQFYKASLLLTLGALFDSVDGRIARLTGTESLFGEQFDSMSDLISFGMAPAMLFYLKFFQDLGRVGMVTSFIFLLCAAMRLARFNANLDRIPSSYFQGLPSPMSALSIVGYVLVSLEYPELNQWTMLSLGYIFVYAILMISTLPFPSFKNSPWVKQHKKQTLLIIFVVLAAILMKEKIMIALLMTTYVLGSLLYYFTHKKEMMHVFTGESETH